MIYPRASKELIEKIKESRKKKFILGDKRRFLESIRNKDGR